MIPRHSTRTHGDDDFAIYWSLREPSSDGPFSRSCMYRTTTLAIKIERKTRRSSETRLTERNKFSLCFPAQIKRWENNQKNMLKRKTILRWRWWWSSYIYTFPFCVCIASFLFGVCVWPTPPGVTKLDNTLRGECIDPGATWKNNTTNRLHNIYFDFFFFLLN